LHDGQWAGAQIVSKDWVKQSLTPAFDPGEEGSKYGFKWWLFPRPDSERMIWAAVGFGGQRLMVFPEEDLIVVFTGWNILANESPVGAFVKRIQSAIRSHECAEHEH
jgi:CubicO group peptidase (beta-lactamase class C family)